MKAPIVRYSGPRKVVSDAEGHLEVGLSRCGDIQHRSAHHSGAYAHTIINESGDRNTIGEKGVRNRTSMATGSIHGDFRKLAH